MEYVFRRPDDTPSLSRAGLDAAPAVHSPPMEPCVLVTSDPKEQPGCTNPLPTLVACAKQLLDDRPVGRKTLAAWNAKEMGTATVPPRLDKKGCYCEPRMADRAVLKQILARGHLHVGKSLDVTELL